MAEAEPPAVAFRVWPIADPRDLKAKNFLVMALLKTVLAILFCLGFGTPFVYFGFQSLRIVGQKDAAGVVTIEYEREHFWGLVRVAERAEKVRGATLKTSLSGRSPGSGNRSLTSGVFIETESAALSLLAGSSNTNDGVKRQLVKSINDFLADAGRTSFENSVSLTNLFGWVGLPFLAFGVLGVLGLPGSLLRHTRKGAA